MLANVITGLADAMIDSLPLVVFTGQVATTLIGSDAFQEADIMGLTMPVTKHNYQVRKASDLPRIIKEKHFILLEQEDQAQSLLTFRKIW